MIPIESDFQSALAPLLRDFVLEKRAVGYLYVTEQLCWRKMRLRCDSAANRGREPGASERIRTDV